MMNDGNATYRDFFDALDDLTTTKRCAASCTGQPQAED